ncbi:MAG TPA: hypothetical protein VI670_15535 [Thermoanaerobaculia bacterium]
MPSGPTPGGHRKHDNDCEQLSRRHSYNMGLPTPIRKKMFLDQSPCSRRAHLALYDLAVQVDQCFLFLMFGMETLRLTVVEHANDYTEMSR